MLGVGGWWHWGLSGFPGVLPGEAGVAVPVRRGGVPTLVGAPELGRAAEDCWHCHSGVKVGPCSPGRFQAAPFPNFRTRQCFGQSALSHEPTRVFWKKFAKLWHTRVFPGGDLHSYRLFSFPAVTELFPVPTAGAAPAVGGAAGTAGPGAAPAARYVWGPAGQPSCNLAGSGFPSLLRRARGWPGNAFVPRAMTLAAA